MNASPWKPPKPWRSPIVVYVVVMAVVCVGVVCYGAFKPVDEPWPTLVPESVLDVQVPAWLNWASVGIALAGVALWFVGLALMVKMSGGVPFPSTPFLTPTVARSKGSAPLPEALAKLAGELQDQGFKPLGDVTAVADPGPDQATLSHILLSTDGTLRVHLLMHPKLPLPVGLLTTSFADDALVETRFPRYNTVQEREPDYITTIQLTAADALRVHQINVTQMAVRHGPPVAVKSRVDYEKIMERMAVHAPTFAKSVRRSWLTLGVISGVLLTVCPLCMLSSDLRDSSLMVVYAIVGGLLFGFMGSVFIFIAQVARMNRLRRY